MITGTSMMLMWSVGSWALRELRATRCMLILDEGLVSTYTNTHIYTEHSFFDKFEIAFQWCFEFHPLSHKQDPFFLMMSLAEALRVLCLNASIMKWAFTTVLIAKMLV